MSVEENGSRANGSREGDIRSSSFDDLARGLARDDVSRGKALRVMGASLLGGALAAVVPGVALADHKQGHVVDGTTPEGGTPPPEGDTTAQQTDPAKQTAKAPPTGGQGCPVPGQVRRGGRCVCPSGTTECNNRCVNSNCSGGQQFVSGSCQCECPSGQLLVGGTCKAECSGGQVRLPNGDCGCPTDPCPATGQTRNPNNCQCECPNQTDVLCGGRCLEPCPTGQFRNAQCQCETACNTAGTVICNNQCVNECTGGQVLQEDCSCACPNQTDEICGGRCVNPCPTGQVRNAQCQCECPAENPVLCGGQCLTECPTGEFRNPTTCECVTACAGGTQVLCNGQCVDECSGGLVRDPVSCDCVCPVGTVACGQPGSERCVDNTCGTGSTFNTATCRCETNNPCAVGQVLCGSQCLAECAGGAVRDPVTCDCACPTGTVACGQPGSERCVDNTCGTGSTFNTATCRCEANACGPANCEGCCGGTGNCRLGNADTACGTGGAICVDCTAQGRVCRDGTCVVACFPVGTSCTADAQCCTGKCRGPSGRQTCQT